MPKTHVLTPEAAPALQDEVVRTLRGGAAAVLPTETVYVAVAREDAAAVLEPARTRGGPHAAHRLVAGPAAAEAAGAVFTAPARRLARRYWPGPLTLVLDTPAGPTGFRVPGHDLAREVAGAVPLVAVELDATELAPALEALGEAAVDLGIDGGRTALGAPPTVVRVPSSGPLEILREGFLDAGPIERAANRLVVFICTGNTCRSPMAEGLFRDAVARRLGLADATPATLADAGWIVASAGIAAGDGLPAAENAQATMAERGIDIGAHASQQLQHDVAERADLLVTMSEGHRRSLLDWLPELEPRVLVLDPRGVPDPIGAGMSTYRATADHISARLGPLADALLAADAAGQAVAAAVISQGGPEEET